MHIQLAEDFSRVKEMLVVKDPGVVSQYCYELYLAKTSSLLLCVPGEEWQVQDER